MSERFEIDIKQLINVQGSVNQSAPRLEAPKPRDMSVRPTRTDMANPYDYWDVVPGRRKNYRQPVTDFEEAQWSSSGGGRGGGRGGAGAGAGVTPPGPAMPTTPGAPPVQGGGGGRGGGRGGGGVAYGTGGAAGMFANFAALWSQIEFGLGVLDRLWQTLKAVDQQFLQMARDAAKYNGQVAAAEAMAEVRDLMAQLRRAEKLGPQLAGYVDTRSRFAEELHDLITDLSTALIPSMEAGVNSLRALVTLVQGFVTVAEKLNNILPENIDAIKWVIEAQEWHNNPIAKALKEMLLVARKFDKDEDTPMLLDQVRDFLDPVKQRTKFEGRRDVGPVPTGKGF